MRSKKIIISVLLIVSIVVLFYSFISSEDSFILGKKPSLPVPDSLLFASAPVLSPQEALHTFRLAEGFKIELVASEPLIQAPVAMDFDAEGRIWVVEMQSYMPDVEGKDETQQTSRIVILEDNNGDGRMDHAKTFLDSLVMPRAISFAKGGILYAAPPNLWFVENINDKPGKKILVDSAYANEGNPEHMANGLMLGIDNWYYNAKSKSRYKYENGQWIKEETEFRGQWGITMDNYGRLFYNTNSNQLRGDLAPPNKLSRNPGFSAKMGINVEIAADQQVYPIRPTTGINRGYKEDMLSKENKLLQFTAACGPVIYRGDKFPEEYKGNAFVCEPAANLIKRNILVEKGPYIEARQAYSDREFLASTDERFRPVNLYNAPDGSLYVVDMYRGIIQHKTYLTEYLRHEIKSRELDKPLPLGRIYRIVYDNESWFEKLINKITGGAPALQQASDEKLVSYLSHLNGWWRDNAQRLLIERNNPSSIPVLVDLLRSGKYENYNMIHALWTLEGMGEHTPEIIKLGVQQAQRPEVVATALRIGERNSRREDAEKTLAIYGQAALNKDPRIQLQLALSLGEFMEADTERVMRMLVDIAKEEGEDSLTREAIASSLQGKETQFLTMLSQQVPANKAMVSLLDEVIEKASSQDLLVSKEQDKTGQEPYLAGKILYERSCAGCHQENGEGLVPIAPPLAGSEWVTGPAERLILIALHGLKGPVTVKGKIYKEPEVQSVMPGFRDNPELTDEKLAALLSYIRNAWSNKGDEIDASTVKTIRKGSMNRKEPFTEKEFIH
jgi:mono/diheme cytochrome c family protein/glucose/arabinose dehydrogenase